MTTDELMIISPIDGDIEIDDKEHVLDKIEQMIQDAIDEHNYNKAIHICSQLVQVNKISGLALAHSLYMIKAAWHLFGVHDDFDDVMASRTGLHRATVQRYTSVWGMYEDHLVPEQYEERIKGLNIKSQIPIAQALDTGRYEIDDENWEVFANATDHQTVAVELRKIKGKEPRPQAIVIMMDRDGGLKALKDGEQVYIGWLNKGEENHLVQQTIRRICIGAGILEQ